ncbi:MAG: hypothetical protein K9J12_10945 [Melioribacteraceae bacterium]|nr:hypothetical protein [Melioribacteraceae bacterium]
MESHKRFLFMGIIIISLGVVFSNSLSDKFGTLGIVFIALGGFLFIVGMQKKRKFEESNKKDE